MGRPVEQAGPKMGHCRWRSGQGGDGSGKIRTPAATHQGNFAKVRLIGKTGLPHQEKHLPSFPQDSDPNKVAGFLNRLVETG